jgi:hypothetical protein
MVLVHVASLLHGGLLLSEKRKICDSNPFRYCKHPESKSCSIFDPIKGVSGCSLRSGGEFFSAKKVVDADVKESFSRHSGRRRGFR